MLKLDEPDRRLTLAGTIHRDPDGYAKCLMLLGSLAPDLVLVELSPFGLAFRRMNRRALLGTLHRNLKEAAKTCGVTLELALLHPEIKAIRLQLDLPFEYRAAVAYSRATGVSCRLVDSSHLSRRLIESWPELIETSNLTWLLSASPHLPSVAELYGTASRLITGTNSAASSTEKNTADAVMERNNDPDEDEPWRARELYLAARIRYFLSSLTPSKPLYLGGWTHLMTGAKMPTLRDILGIDPSRCILLPSVIPREAIGRRTEPITAMSRV